MTDLERVRALLAAMPASPIAALGIGEALDIIDAHLEEDAAELARLRERPEQIAYDAALAQVKQLRAQAVADGTEIARLREDLKQVTFARADAALKVRLENENAKLRGKHEVLREKYVLVHAERDRLRYELSVADYPGKNELVRELARLRERFDQMQEERDSFGHQLARANGENARLRAMKGVGPDHEVVELGTLHRLVTENARLRETLEQVTANRDSLLLRIEETEDDCRRLREVVNIGAQNYDDLKEDYTELLEAVKAAMNVWYDGPIWPKPYDDDIAEAKRLRRLIKEKA